jgi:hypothetical protein
MRAWPGYGQPARVGDAGWQPLRHGRATSALPTANAPLSR